MADLNDNLLNEADEQFVESSHKFVKPVRYFKSNDPYYWEVDNIPIKQLEENILFLRDQVANNLSISGIGREDLAELRPFVNGTNRTVYVNPGRYTARINDAYNKGINLLNEVYANWLNPGGSGPPIDSGYSNTAQRKVKKFTLPLNVLKLLAGEIIDQPLLDTGLYTFLQHHNSEPLTTASLEFANSQDNMINPGLTAAGMPKSKAAIWRSFGHNFEEIAYQNDLQQESVEFTRFWGGSIRTAIVDVAETLSISVPDFEATDYANTTALTPATRIDLLFVYSHPIDSISTTILNPPGTPEQISAPRLGILKGAGVIALNQGHNALNDYDNEAGYFDTDNYANASSNPANYFTSENTVDLDILHNRMISTVADTQQTQIGLRGSFSNIPSPEDLLNLTPLFESQLSKDNLALVGQSVLPIAYVIVKRGQPVIVTNDLFDIRPFMRTAELSYNERAGVAAANPPLSFANPAVGKVEVQKDILDVRDVLMTEINKPNPISQPVAMGTIYGGTMWGPEGILAELEWQYWGAGDGTLTDKALSILKSYHVPGFVQNLPKFPGWDINTEYFPGGGEYRNDRLFSAVKHNTAGQFNFPTSINEVDEDGNPLITDMPVSQFGYIGGAQSHGRMCPMYGSLFVKKTFTFDQLPLTELGYDDFDVRVDLINCSLMTGSPSIDIGGNADIRTGAHQTGIFVEKTFAGGVPHGFTIFVCVGSPAAHEGAPWFGQPDNSNNITGNSYNQTQENFFRKSYYFSRVGVITTKLLDRPPTKSPNISGDRTTPQGTSMRFHGTGFDTFDDGISGNQKPTFNPMLVTYPTVNFTIVGYKADIEPYARKQVFSTVGTENANGDI